MPTPLETTASYDASRLLAQADALDARARALRAEASDLASEALELRTQADQMTMTRVTVKRAPRDARPGRLGATTPDPFSDAFLDRVAGVLEGSGPLAMSDFVEHLNASAARVRAALAELEENGRVVRTGIKRGTRYRLPADDAPASATVHPFGSYETMVRDVAVRLDTFTFLDLQRELGDISEATLRRWVRALEDRGVIESARDGASKVYAYVPPPDNAPTHHPRHESPERIAARTAAPMRSRGGVVIGTGRTTRAGSKSLDELIRKVRPMGVKVEKTGGGHMAWHCPSGAVIPTSSTPSSSSTDKIRKQLRDAGVPV